MSPWLIAFGLSTWWPLAAAAGLVIPPGQVSEFSAPLSPELRQAAGRDANGGFTEALVAVAVPKDFDPGRTWPVLVISATSDRGYNSSRANLRWFAAAAMQAGWIVVAADPDRVVAADDDSNGLRYALVLAALARLRQEWPALARWPRAFGGISGGAKRSAWLAAISALDGYRPLGVFQAGCNQPVMENALEFYHPPRAQFLAVPVFLSSGTDDPIATTDQMRSVETDLKGDGFRHVRLERFPGGHEVFQTHIGQGLQWFLKVASTSAQ
jgi:pimeloyl-ACP methyl ester carboxylesterase